MIYFIADTHFYHENVIKFSNRPFINADEMNRKLISNWNQVVAENDEVYILGDFLFRGKAEQANEVLTSLNGKKYLIKGNHEHYLDSPDFDQNLFEWVKDYYTFRYKKRKFILFHYPILEWEDYFQNSIHLYGHVHNNRTDYFKDILGDRAINVGADMIDFTPISIEQILDIVKE